MTQKFNVMEGGQSPTTAIHPLDFMDATCSIGHSYTRILPSGLDESAESLLKTMNRLGIHEACPSSALAAEYSIEEGNGTLLNDIKGHRRLHPAWLMAGHHTGEFSRPEILLQKMKKSHVQLTKLILQSTYGYLDSLDLLIYEDLFNMLNEHRIPLMLDCYTFQNLPTKDLHALLNGWPNLPIILTFPKLIKEGRMLYYLFEKFRNFHISLSGFQTLGGIEKVVKHFGAQTLIFGSHYPYFTPLQTMMQLIYSEISEEDKKKIAGNNLRQLMAAALTGHP